ncbi:MAG: hypothetical protein KKE30_06925 [Gammaproteobacteria bacterium]|nr:hypothetical protein [Gammaproteobacteria bacterium]MBU1556853.1 hypothetical protein [Gammaproteobacteria bacterium]MBU2071067.1 hypothetical protein [Gammaproteobacteria bacterium]MBU2184335.1 hypothetical protein [Gammaproteobacteria bacterium]MBU2206408.1 hypothetical protein [Gammaproteobacteria bacterium]
MTENKPEPGTPEFEAWLLARAQKWSDELFTAEIPEELAHVDSGIMAGPRSWADVTPEKTIASRHLASAAVKYVAITG